MKKTAWLGALLALGALAVAGADAPLTVTVAPERVWIVESDGVRKVANFMPDTGDLIEGR